MQSNGTRNEKKYYWRHLFNSTTYLALSICVFDQLFHPLPIKLFQIYAQFWTPWAHVEVIKLFVKWWVQKLKKNIIGVTSFNSTTYLAFHVGLCVWSTFSSHSYQAISNLTTDLDSLGQGRRFETICKVIKLGIKKYIIGDTFSILLLT